MSFVGPVLHVDLMLPMVCLVSMVTLRVPAANQSSREPMQVESWLMNVANRLYVLVFLMVPLFRVGKKKGSQKDNHHLGGPLFWTHTHML